MSDFYHERVSMADIDKGDLPLDMLVMMRLKIDQALTQRGIVPIQAVAALSENYQQHRDAAFYKKGLEDAVNEINKRGGDQLDHHWLQIKLSMNSLTEVAQCNPGPDTSKVINELSGELIKHLDIIDSLFRQQLPRPGNIFFDMTDSGVAAGEQVRVVREKVKQFSDMGGSDKALAWFREIVKRDYLNLEQAMYVPKVKQRGRIKKGDNTYISERGEQIAKTMNISFDTQGFIAIGKAIFSELHPIAKILDKEGKQWQAYFKIKACSNEVGGKLTWDENKLRDVVRNAMRGNAGQNNFDQPTLPSKTGKDGLN